MTNGGVVADATDDAELVSAAQRGELDSFGALVARYQGRVYNACYRICRDPDDAADLTQTAFLRAFEALARFEVRANFYTWLFRIAVNATLSHQRRLRRRPRLSLEQFNDGEKMHGPELPADAEYPASRLENAELRERLERALGTLNDDERTVIVLKDVEGMNYAAMAQVLDVPVGTVKSRIHRARLALRAALAGEGRQRERA